MKKIILLIIIIVSVHEVSSQGVRVTYKVKAENIFNTNRPDTLPDMVQKTFKDAERNFENIEYILKIDNNESFFEMEDKLLNDGNRKAKLTKALAGFSGKIYCNTNENIKLRQSDVYGQTFLISSPFNTLEWNITKESKEIGGFKAYKAILRESYDTGKNKEFWEIVAWFAPALNHSFGPGGYGGLPGLIVELSRAGKIYKIEDFEKIRDDIEVLRPTEGKKVTQKEFEEIGRKMSLN